MNNSIISLVRVKKNGKFYYNVYVFGVAVKPVNTDNNSNDYLKLRYAVQAYCESNGIEIPFIDKDVDTNEKKK